MTMVHLLSLDVLVKLKACSVVFQKKGLHARYLGDAAIRHYQERSINELNQDLGTNHDEITIQGGIGVLILKQTGNEWHPAQTLAQRALNLLTEPLSLPADAATIDTRRKICESCAFHVAGTCNQCGCNTKIKTTLRESTCPLEKW